MAIGIDLSGKVACVTGAGNGIGKEIALKLAEAGADVVVSDVKLGDAEGVAKEIQAMGRRSFAIKTDVSDRHQVFAMVDQTVEKMGYIDIIVNNAGISMGKAFVDVTEKDHDRIYAVNVKGVLFGMQAAMKYFKEQRSGKIINISTQAAKEGCHTYSTYASSKAAALSLTQAMAKEAGEYDINVNAVCPGMVKTDLYTKETGGRPGLLEMMQQTDKYKEMTTEEIWASECSGMLLGRPQDPVDIAMMVVYLASEFARNITGQGINVSGGMIME
jgi:meso-butanediol dehydrogenase/(S,S)-butanediol dehydrogenase/diacetyl reductase